MMLVSCSMNYDRENVEQDLEKKKEFRSSMESDQRNNVDRYNAN